MSQPTCAQYFDRGCRLPLATVCLLFTLAAPAWAQSQRSPIRDQEHFFRGYVWSYKEIQQQRIVMQKFDYSCGAAVLATVARYYWGDDVDETTFLKLLPKILTEAQFKERVANGLTLTDLRNLANKAGYEAVMGRVQFHELAEAKVPLIVGITVRKHEHFAVFRGTDGAWAYLADPLRGNIRVPIPVFLEQWQLNAVLVVAKPNTKVKEPNPMAVRRQEIDRGVLNDQTVLKNGLMPTIPNPIVVP